MLSHFDPFSLVNALPPLSTSSGIMYGGGTKTLLSCEAKDSITFPGVISQQGVKQLSSATQKE